MIAPNATRSWLAQAWEVTSDLVLAMALIWTLPLLLGAVAAIVGAPAAANGSSITNQAEQY